MMKPIILYSKKFKLSFDEQDVSTIHLESFIEEVSDKYAVVDTNPIVTYKEDFIIVTLKVTEKGEQKKMGFSF